MEENGVNGRERKDKVGKEDKVYKGIRRERNGRKVPAINEREQRKQDLKYGKARGERG